jgi:2-amino-4-hydroxy-6-hydroxymethyldihydropteridine diphosphokinase
MVRSFIALGANLGEPQALIKEAITALHTLPHCHFVAASSLYRTAPVGLIDQPDFINAVVACDVDEAALSAPQLLAELLRIEARFGRQRSVRNAPRTLDLDLLLFGEFVCADPHCTLPHPRLHERAFVLAPLAEIAPTLILPGRGVVSEWLARCAAQSIEKLP